MKQIIKNVNNININDVKDIKYKSRAIIINENDEILLTVNGGVYLLPGGSMNNNETYIETVKREVLEETGFPLITNKIVPLVSYEEYVENFPKRDGVTFVSRYTKTMYFYYSDNAVVNEDKMNLSENEKKNFSYLWININDIEKFLIDNRDARNLKRPYFDRELLMVLNEYSLYKEDTKEKKMRLSN